MARSSEPPRSEIYDVAVIGAGIAGVAASIFLRQAGRSVVCLDTRSNPHHRVGESLDWCSPGLLRRVGLSSETLIADQIATYKKKIVLRELGKPVWEAAPPSSIRRSPLRFETVTLHVDRTALDQRLYEKALALGTTFVWERVMRVHFDGDRVTGCTTNSRRRVEARAYIDASGTARLLAREMRIPWTEYGRKKVCLWTYFDTPPLADGTTFFLDNGDSYLSWIWDIPISPQRTSVGFVLPAETVQFRRRGGATNKDVLHAELARYSRFESLLAAQPEFEVHTTTFRPYVTARVCGRNWFMAGESASMPDPLTGNGVTSAIRHARYITDAIRVVDDTGEIAPGHRRTYSRHVVRLGHAFNEHIENAIYRSPLRWGIGLPAATIVYTVFGFFMNAMYARFDPRGPVGMVAFDLLFVVARWWVAAWTAVARIALWFRRPPRDAGVTPEQAGGRDSRIIEGSQAARRSSAPGTGAAARAPR
jgi:flavin-dependent dehydrogenase